MNSLAIDFNPLATKVELTQADLIVVLADGRTLSAPLIWFPRLAQASSEQLSNYEILGKGEGIHWPELDEDISVLGLLEGRKAL